MVVLHEGCRNASELLKDLLIIGFHEKSARIAEHLGFEQDDIGQIGLDYFHATPASESIGLTASSVEVIIVSNMKDVVEFACNNLSPLLSSR